MGPRNTERCGETEELEWNRPEQSSCSWGVPQSTAIAGGFRLKQVLGSLVLSVEGTVGWQKCMEGLPQVLGVGVCIQKALAIKVEEFVH